MKNITGKLVGVSIGAGVGLFLAHLSGANKIGATIVFATLGGILAPSAKESVSSFSGGSKRHNFLQPPPQGKDGSI